jgi:hypothetical protein
MMNIFSLAIQLKRWNTSTIKVLLIKKKARNTSTKEIRVTLLSLRSRYLCRAPAFKPREWLTHFPKRCPKLEGFLESCPSSWQFLPNFSLKIFIKPRKFSPYLGQSETRGWPKSLVSQSFKFICGFIENFVANAPVLANFFQKNSRNRRKNLKDIRKLLIKI